MEKRKQGLCETCKNNFVSREYELTSYELGQMINWEGFKKETSDNTIKTNEFCVYTHEKENAVKCSFYNRAPQITELREIKIDASNDGYQDIDRTFTPNERTLSTRIDCRNEA